jgi:DNA-binding NarL/FixJ family response regulator
VRAERARPERPGAVRLAIVDDHPVVRKGLADLLWTEPGVKVVGEAGTATEANRLIECERPEVVVLDLTLGDADGMELAQAWLRTHPALKILVLSMQDSALFADRLLAIGVMAFVPKSCSREEFLTALHATLRGDVYITDDQRARVQLWSQREDPSRPEVPLSEREIAVLRLLASGLSAAAIARALDMAPKTVYSHRRNISAKLGIGSGREMLRYAMQWFRSAA